MGRNIEPILDDIYRALVVIAEILEMGLIQLAWKKIAKLN